MAGQEDRPSRLRRVMQHLREGKFPEAKEEVKDGLYEGIVEPAAKEGRPTGLRSAVAAGLGAAVDYAVPDEASASEAASMIAQPVRAIKKGMKALRPTHTTVKKTKNPDAMQMTKEQREALMKRREEIRMQSRKRGTRTPHEQYVLDRIEAITGSPDTLTYK